MPQRKTQHTPEIDERVGIQNIVGRRLFEALHFFLFLTHSPLFSMSKFVTLNAKEQRKVNEKKRDHIFIGFTFENKKE